MRFLSLLASSLALCCALSGCASFPELDAAVSERARAADFPDLVPAERILSKRAAGRLGEGDGDALLARAENLRRRGEILRRLPVIDEAARLRFAEVLRRLGG